MIPQLSIKSNIYLFHFGSRMLSQLIIFSLLAVSVKAQPAEVKWVNEHLIPLKFVKAENGLDDMQPLNQRIGDARIVAMGECTHGSAEVFQMKHRMLEYLVKEKGFTIFAIEANMPEAYELNQYILEGKGDVKLLMGGMYFWTWNTEEVKDMIEWMKRYNDTATRKIRFTGFDAQECRLSIRFLRNFLSTNYPSLQTVLDDYDSCYRQNRGVEALRKKKINAQLKGDAQMILDTLRQLKSSGNTRVDEWVLQQARLLLQFPDCMGGLELRDRVMAENAKWILDQDPTAKMMIWAHNEHIRMETNKFGVERMGKFLREWYGKSMVSIAFSTEEGTYTAAQFKKGKGNGVWSNNLLTASPEKSCEAIFRQASTDNFILDWRDASPNDPSTVWIYKSIQLRHIGAIVNDKYQFIDIQPIKDYDMIIFLKRTRATECFWGRK